MCSKSGFFLILLFLSACSSDDSGVAAPALSPESCDRLAVPNQWVVKYRNEKHPRLVSAYDKKSIHKSLGHGRIEWLEANYKLSKPRDLDSINLPASLNNAEVQFENSYIDAIGAEYAWSKGYWGKGITVAVVDSGVDLENPRIKGALAMNALEFPNGLDDDQNGFIDDIFGWNFTSQTDSIKDESGHGTHIAGIIAANHTSLLARGIAPKAQILAVDFVTGDKGDEFTALQAVQYAIDRKANVINNSWSSVCSVFLQQAFERWQNENIIFVSSAGNDGKSLLELPLAPANLNLINHITVGSYGTNFKKSHFSNTGPSVFVLAPGEMILGIPQATISQNQGSRSGTSMSAAFVSGALAIGWAHRPDLSAQEILGVFKEVHRPLPPDTEPRNLNIQKFILEIDKRFPAT